MCFVGADSGVMHIAAAVATPVVAIFGPSNHAAWAPWTPASRSIVVRSAPECSPCSYVEHSIGLREGCAARTCMKLVEVGQVIRGVRALLQETDNEDHGARFDFSGCKQHKTKRVHILGIPVDVLTYETWMDLIQEWIEDGDRCYHVCTTNPEFMMIAKADVNFRNILRRADLCIPDGIGLLWAAKRQGVTLPQRVTGSDGIFVIAQNAAKQGWRLFLLGAAPGIADLTGRKLKAQYSGLRIAGTYAGSPAPEEEDSIVSMINQSKADILLVAYGAPVQDKWIARNIPRLEVKMAMGVGGSFDFVVGSVPRAPIWMRQYGLEWLYRLYKQPWRFRRMLRLPRFAVAVLLSK